VLWLRRSKRAGRRFGRSSAGIRAPDDLLFFDWDADEPVSMTEMGWQAGFAEMRETAARSGLDPAYIAAWQEVGYFVTEANQHLFSAAQVRAYLDAVARHQDRDGEDDGDDWGSGRLGSRAPGPGRGGGRGPAGRRRPGVARRPPRHRAAPDAADYADAAGLAATTMVTVMLAWLTGARDQASRPATAATQAPDQVREHLGAEVADDTLVLAGVLGHPRSPDLTVAEALERAGEDLVVLLLSLVCGIVATTGGGDVDWLIQVLHPDHDPDQTT
jgi:hypothetical protein